MSRQEIEAAAGSTNLQAGGNISVGMSFSEVRQYTQDAIELNLLKFRSEAEALIEERVADLAGRFTEAMRSKSPEALQNVSDPDVLYAIVSAGTDFARTGDDALGDTLVGMLADRCEATPRSLMAVVLNDAVATAGRLTDAQMAILSVVWRLTRTRYRRMRNLGALKTYFETNVQTLVELLPMGDASYWHLQYAGCAAVGIMESDLRTVLLDVYPGVFSSGFTAEEVPEDLRPHLGDPRLFVPCLRDPDRVQVSAIDDTVVLAKAASAGVPELSDSLISLQKAHLLSLDEVQAALEADLPWTARLFQVWSKSPLQYLSLTSVGIAIAHANYRRMTGDNPPLSIWISEAASP